MGRRLVTAAGLLSALIAAAWIALRWIDIRGSLLIAAIQAAYPLAMVPALVAALLLGLRRQWWGVAAGMALAGVVCATGVPALTRHTVAARDGDFTVLAANLEYGGADPDQVMAAIDRVKPSAVILIEVTQEAQAALESRGLRQRYPDQVGVAEAHAGGLLIYGRGWEIVDAWNYGTRRQPSVNVASAGGPKVLLHGVHTKAPTSPAEWGTDLDFIADFAAGHPGPLIMAGDFNATYSHPAFRHAASGLTDTLWAAGAGWSPTWPSGKPVPPFAQIDHILVRGVEVVDSGTLTFDGTDHKAVWARLRLP